MNLKAIKLFLANNSPAILTGVSIIGVLTTIITASQDTLKARDISDKAQPRNGKEEFKITWKCYIPTAISATTTIGCILGSHYCSVKQKEVLTSAYLLSQTTLQEYQKRVIERIGQNKERAIREEVTKAVADRQVPVIGPYNDNMDIIDTGHGNTLFYDVPGDRYFKSDINYLKTQANDLNRDVRTEMWYDWNEICYRWGLPFKKYGSELIFDIDRPFDPKFVPEMMENGQVRINVDYELYPKVVER